MLLILFFVVCNNPRCKDSKKGKKVKIKKVITHPNPPQGREFDVFRGRVVLPACAARHIKTPPFGRGLGWVFYIAAFTPNTPRMAVATAAMIFKIIDTVFFPLLLIVFSRLFLSCLFFRDDCEYWELWEGCEFREGWLRPSAWRRVGGACPTLSALSS